MDFIPNTDKDRAEMLRVIGINDIKDLFKDIPESLLLKEELKINKGMSEIEVRKHLISIREKNKIKYTNFRGAGSYNHFIPAVVPHLISRSEFYTAYTPYQPEISQGILQAIFEYQTLICEITGMDVANASMYDGSSALAEAAIMASRITRKDEIIISSAVNPEYKQVVKTYCLASDLKLKEINFNDGVTDYEKLKQEINENTSCVLIQNPNYFGCVEDLERVKENLDGSLLVVCVSDPTSLGILKSSQAEIVVGEGQSFGNPMSFGGPYLGFMACKSEYMRQLPGRLVGETVDSLGEKGYILTLQAREQHIRREKATSNICSNQALNALAATIYLASIGKNLKKLANHNYQKANYAYQMLKQAGCSIVFTKPFYNEFVVKVDDAKKVNLELMKNKIIGGLELEKDYSQLKDCLLFCVTEMISKEEIDCMVQIINEIK